MEQTIHRVDRPTLSTWCIVTKYVQYYYYPVTFVCANVPVCARDGSVQVSCLMQLWHNICNILPFPSSPQSIRDVMRECRKVDFSCTCFWTWRRDSFDFTVGRVSVTLLNIHFSWSNKMLFIVYSPKNANWAALTKGEGVERSNKW